VALRLTSDPIYFKVCHLYLKLLGRLLLQRRMAMICYSCSGGNFMAV
jgi:hypothetical protein